MMHSFERIHRWARPRSPPLPALQARRSLRHKTCKIFSRRVGVMGRRTSPTDCSMVVFHYWQHPPPPRGYWLLVNVMGLCPWCGANSSCTPVCGDFLCSDSHSHVCSTAGGCPPMDRSYILFCILMWWLVVCLVLHLVRGLSWESHVVVVHMSTLVYVAPVNSRPNVPQSRRIEGAVFVFKVFGCRRNV